ncbi:MAG: DNA polymerase III subunit gamma/tau, partial [Bacteroidota bacterium]
FMENFVVSARKYRPATFDMVVGQKSITNTLKNAIKNNHLAQAFLFCGPRGVGKTTCARIMAKTINCENLTENIEACNKCKSCVSFNESNSFNVHELDAASNNSVEDIRSLVEQVRIPPHIGQYKVYVIDEVHMLSTAAFNAFLKTLEEPPAYAKFILATTEKHKIIPTILSRCQIFDFSRITIDDIAKQLQFVAQNENIETDYDALHLIAQKADGAMRDALSIFDQIVSFAGNSITYKAVAENLNVLDYDYFFAMTNHLLSGDTTEILLLFNQVIDKGFDGAHFIGGFSSHLRNLLVCKDPKTIKLMEVGENIKQKYLEQGAKCHPSFLLTALDISNRCDINYRTSNNRRLHVELALLQIAALLQNQEIPASSQEKASLPQANTATSNKATDNPVANKPSEAKKAEKPDAPAAPPPKPNDSSQQPKQTLRQPGIGINKAMKKDDEKKKSEQLTSEDYSNKPKEDFTVEQLMSAWKKLKGKYEDSSASIFTALNTHDPVLKNDNQIIIAVNNVVQKEGIIEQKPQILSFFRHELNNYAIRIDVEITENVKIQKAYLPADKYQKMLAKRPEINRLKDGLDLDLVY